jgi:hypothetical protein
MWLCMGGVRGVRCLAEEAEEALEEEGMGQAMGQGERRRRGEDRCWCLVVVEGVSGGRERVRCIWRAAGGRGYSRCHEPGCGPLRRGSGAEVLITVIWFIRTRRPMQRDYEYWYESSSRSDHELPGSSSSQHVSIRA